MVGGAPYLLNSKVPRGDDPTGRGTDGIPVNVNLCGTKKNMQLYSMSLEELKELCSQTLGSG